MTVVVEPRCDIAVLFQTHGWNRSVAERFARIRRELAGHADCFVLLQDDSGPIRQEWTAFLEAMNAPAALQPFDPQALERQLGYRFFKKARLVLGSTHYPIMNFARAENYRFYWLIEFDVECRGPWRDLFDACQPSHADLIVSHPPAGGLAALAILAVISRALVAANAAFGMESQALAGVFPDRPFLRRGDPGD
jgi:hypothetical protein